MYQVVKRDGKIVEFEISKISKAITKAFEALGKQYHPSVIDMLALRVSSITLMLIAAAVSLALFLVKGNAQKAGETK